MEGATLMAKHTPGHSDDHMAFWLEEEESFFSGDNVLGWGTTFVQYLFEYTRSLRLMLSMQPRSLYPGHGPIRKDGCAHIQSYLDHRSSREAQVLRCLRALDVSARREAQESSSISHYAINWMLKKAPTLKGHTAADIAAQIYTVRYLCMFYIL